MLILARRVGESLVIGDDVTVTVLGIKENQEGHRLLSITLVSYAPLSRKNESDRDMCQFLPDTQVPRVLTVPDRMLLVGTPLA